MLEKPDSDDLRRVSSSHPASFHSPLLTQLQPHRLLAVPQIQQGLCAFVLAVFPGGHRTLLPHLVPSSILHFTYLFDYRLDLLLEWKLNAVRCECVCVHGHMCACVCTHFIHLLDDNWFLLYSALYFQFENRAWCLIGIQEIFAKYLNKYLFYFWTRFDVG